jgi:hypothetical protein
MAIVTVLAVFGAGLLAGGLWFMLAGFDAVLVERSWAQFVGGAVLTGAGAVIVALALALIEVVRIRKTLIELGNSPSVPMPAVLPATPEPVAARPEAPRPEEPEPAVAEKPTADAPGAQKPRSERTRALDKATANVEQALSDIIAAGAKKPAVAGDSRQDQPETPAKPANPALSEPERPAAPPPAVAETAVQMQPGKPTTGGGSTRNDWLIGPEDEAGDLGGQPPAVVAARAPPAPERPKAAEKPAAPAEIAAKPAVPAEVATNSHEAEPAPSPAAAPADTTTAARPPPAPTRPGATVIRTFESGGIVYSIFTDGSIIAEAPSGTLRFASLNEMRDFVASRAAARSGGKAAG